LVPVRGCGEKPLLVRGCLGPGVANPRMGRRTALNSLVVTTDSNPNETRQERGKRRKEKSLKITLVVTLGGEILKSRARVETAVRKLIGSHKRTVMVK